MTAPGRPVLDRRRVRAARLEVQWMRDVSGAEHAALTDQVADLDAYLGRQAA